MTRLVETLSASDIRQILDRTAAILARVRGAKKDGAAKDENEI